MRRAKRLPALRCARTARNPHRAPLLMHAGGVQKSARDQRAKPARAKNIRRIQGGAWRGVRLLFRQKARAIADAISQRRERISHFTPVDDQPLAKSSRSVVMAFGPQFSTARSNRRRVAVAAPNKPSSD